MPVGLLVEGGPILDPDAPQTALEQRLGGKVPSAVDLGDHHDIRPCLLHQRLEILDLPEKQMSARHHVGSVGRVVEEADDAKGPRAGGFQVSDQPAHMARPENEDAHGHLLARPGSEEAGPPGQEPGCGHEKDPEERVAPDLEYGDREPGRREYEGRDALANEEPSHQIPAPQNLTRLVEVTQVEHKGDRDTDLEEARREWTIPGPGSGELGEVERSEDDGEVPEEENARQS